MPGLSLLDTDHQRGSAKEPEHHSEPHCEPMLCLVGTVADECLLGLRG